MSSLRDAAGAEERRGKGKMPKERLSARFFLGMQLRAV